jgi:hypothetical protein
VSESCWCPADTFPACYNLAMRRFADTAAIAGVVMLGPLLWSSPANAQQASPPQVPPSVQTRPGEEIVLLAHGSGFQIYVCRAGTDARSLNRINSACV